MQSRKLLYYAIDFCLLSFNDHLLASSQDLHPLEITLRWLFAQVERCLTPNPMLPHWAHNNCLATLSMGRGENKEKSQIFLLSVHRYQGFHYLSWGTNKVLMTNNKVTSMFTWTGAKSICRYILLTCSRNANMQNLGLLCSCMRTVWYSSFVPVAESTPTPSVHLSDHSYNTVKGESAQLAQIWIDRPTFITDWVMFPCKKDKSAFDTDKCIVSALLLYRSELDWSQMRLSQPWCRKNWLPNYLPIHF